jgi:SAM-dependent methyltransferase
MPDITSKVREHYSATNLTDRIKSALATIALEDQTLTVAQLAPLDQFHTRGILATAELATVARLESSTRVLDVGCGIGGPARYLASTFGCKVIGVDLSAGFIEAANYLTDRCGLSDRVAFQVGDTLHLPFEEEAFDAVFLQHVAMNIEDRPGLYAEVRRILKPGGRFATYDLVLREGDVVYPAPWARDASTSFLLSASDTRTMLEQPGFRVILWRDDTRTRARVVQGGRPATERSEPRCRDGSGFRGQDRQPGPQHPREPPRGSVLGPDPRLKPIVVHGLLKDAWPCQCAQIGRNRARPQSSPNL